MVLTSSLSLLLRAMYEHNLLCWAREFRRQIEEALRESAPELMILSRIPTRHRDSRTHVAPTRDRDSSLEACSVSSFYGLH